MRLLRLSLLVFSCLAFATSACAEILLKAFGLNDAELKKAQEAWAQPAPAKP